MVDQVAGRKTRVWTVPTECASIRLDAFAGRCLPEISRREIDRLIKAKYFLLDGRVGKKGERLASGGKLEFIGPTAWLVDEPAAGAELAVGIVYEDSSLIVLNKPAGMATHGFSAREQATLANYIAARWPELLGVGKSRWEPGLVHRLDIETSGLVLVAKNQITFDRLRTQFRRRQVRKTYWALVWGDTEIEGKIEFPLAHDRQDRRRMRIAQSTGGSKPARRWQAKTRYRKLTGTEGLSLLEIEMATGVTHQIRVHLSAIGHPIVGDALYAGATTENFGLPCHFLHAKGLELRHPDDNRRIAFDAELAAELRALLKRLSLGI